MKTSRMDDKRTTLQAAEWLETLKSAAPAQRAAFVSWLLESRRHVRNFLLVSAFDKELRKIDPQRRHDVDALLAEASADVVALPEITVPAADRGAARRGWSSWRRARRVGAVAAAIAIVACAALLMPSSNSKRSEFATTLGEQSTLKLPDGSLVHLNTRSRVTLLFSQTARDVRLDEGEALFIVAKDAARPFRVVTGDAVVQAIGTEFNVYRRAEGTRVSVVEGRVRVLGASREGGGAGPQPDVVRVPLSAGEEADITRDGRVTKRPAPDTSTVVAWRQRRLVFRNDTLADVATEFNRYNAMQLRIEGENARQRRFTGVLDADRPETLLRILEEEGDLRIEEGAVESKVTGRR